VLVFHFSAPGAGYGSTQDLRQLVPPTSSGQLSSALTALYAEPVPWDTGANALAFATINAVWAQIIQPELTAASGDQALVRALADWRQFVFLLNLNAHRGDLNAALADGSLALTQGAPAFEVLLFTAGRALVDQQIAAAIAGNRSLCKQSHDLNALANVVFWQGLAGRYDPAAAGSSLESNGCATIEIGTFNPASNLTKGSSDSLQIGFVLAFTDGTHVPAAFDLTLHGSGFAFRSTGTPEATVGQPTGEVVTVNVSASADPPYELRASACWSLDGVARNFCSGQRQRSFGGPASPAPAGSGAVPQPIGVAIFIDSGLHLPIVGPCQQIRAEFGIGHTGPNGWQFSLASEGAISVSGSGTIVQSANSTAVIQASRQGGFIAVSGKGWNLSPSNKIEAQTTIKVDELIGVFFDQTANIRVVVAASSTPGAYTVALPGGTILQLVPTRQSFVDFGQGRDINLTIDATGAQGRLNGNAVILPRQGC
jgi:hypothetical protein